MSKKDFTRREFIKATGASVASVGLMGMLPGLSLGAKNYTFGSASAAGSWYPLAVAMAKVINDNVPGYNVTGVTTPGASRENIIRIDQGEMELGWSTANFLYKGYNAIDPFKEKRNISGWFAAYPGYFTIAARRGSGIKSIADFKGKRIAIGTPGSHTNLDNIGLILKNAGLTPGKDFKAEYLRLPEVVQKMIDGHIDACTHFVGIGTSGFVQMADSADVVFLDLPKELWKPIIEQDSTYFIGGIPAGTYRGQDKEIMAAGLAFTTVCSPELSDDFMYQATKAVFENLPFITASSANFKQTKLEHVYRGMPVPIHPGAAKYFKEKGITR